VGRCSRGDRLFFDEEFPMLEPRCGALAIVGAALFAGCSVTTQVTHSDRSSVEQRLLVESLVESLDRSLRQLPLQPLEGRTVALGFHELTDDQAFAKEFCRARLQERGIRVAGASGPPDPRLEVFARALGVDEGETFLGLPALNVPVLGFALPEIALFKAHTHRGYAELQTFASDGASGESRERSHRAVGKSAYDQYTILILINFKYTDLDAREEEH
jgi:hypothetical protein